MSPIEILRTVRVCVPIRLSLRGAIRKIGIQRAFHLFEQNSPARVSLAVYYESLSNNSVSFFTKQLNPTLQKPGFAERVDLTLVPYGRAKRHQNGAGWWIFECENGVLECMSNEDHACAISVLASNQKSLGYVTCLMEETKYNFAASSMEAPVGRCASRYDISNQDLKQIQECDLTPVTYLAKFAEMGSKTDMLQPKLEFCPWIVYNGVYNATDQFRSVINFQDVLCEHISSLGAGKFEGCAPSSAFRLTVQIEFCILATLIALFY